MKKKVKKSWEWRLGRLDYFTRQVDAYFQGGPCLNDKRRSWVPKLSRLNGRTPVIRPAALAPGSSRHHCEVKGESGTLAVDCPTRYGWRDQRVSSKSLGNYSNQVLQWGDEVLIQKLSGHWGHLSSIIS